MPHLKPLGFFPGLVVHGLGTTAARQLVSDRYAFSSGRYPGGSQRSAERGQGTAAGDLANPGQYNRPLGGGLGYHRWCRPIDGRVLNCAGSPSPSEPTGRMTIGDRERDMVAHFSSVKTIRCPSVSACRRHPAVGQTAICGRHPWRAGRDGTAGVTSFHCRAPPSSPSASARFPLVVSRGSSHGAATRLSLRRRTISILLRKAAALTCIWAGAESTVRCRGSRPRLL